MYVQRMGFAELLWLKEYIYSQEPAIVQADVILHKWRCLHLGRLTDGHMYPKIRAADDISDIAYACGDGWMRPVASIA